jgi:hypothetical protein
MVDAKSRLKVQRLLGSDFRSGDLSDLFLFARDHCDGRQTVVDIGDFVAHHSERDRGIITNSTRDFFTVVRYHMSTFMPNGLRRPFDGARMPPATKNYFKIAANRIEAKTIREKTRLHRKEAHERLNNIANLLTKNDDETWILPRDLTGIDMKLLECISSYLVLKPAFDSERLIEDFLATLKSNGLITREELRSNRARLGEIVQLFAVALMHNCVVQIDDGTTTQLRARLPPKPSRSSRPCQTLFRGRQFLWPAQFLRQISIQLSIAMPTFERLITGILRSNWRQIGCYLVWDR